MSSIDKRCAYSHVYVIYLFLDSATRFLVRKMLSLNYPYVSPIHSKSRKSFRPLRNLKQNALCSLSSLKVQKTVYHFLWSFLIFSLVCLWGNSTDLSLLINMTEDQIKSLQSTGGDHLAATEKNILGNDLNRLWEHAKYLRERTGGRIDFILDNAGFELYCDCVYGIYSTHIITKVYLIIHYS